MWAGRSAGLKVSTEKKKILIADDSPVVLEALQTVLRGAGLDVVTARDGLEALEKAFADDVSLAVLDVNMPRMTGYQACRLLKTEPHTQDLPVVILTGRDQAGDRFWGLETGADYYLTKDAEPARLVELVKNILAAPAAERPKVETPSPSGIDVLSRVNELLDRRLYQATILSQIGRVARSLAHFDETFTTVMGLVAQVVDYTVGGMAFVEEASVEVLLLQNRPAEPAVIEDARARILQAVAAERPGQTLPRAESRVFEPRGSGRGGPPEASLQAFASFPITTNGRLTGLLSLGGRAAGRIDADTHAFLAQVANQAHIVVENARLVERLRDLAVRDSLTGLYNHRHAMELLAAEFGRVGRYAAGVSLLMLDLDQFKRINDEHGHPAGDSVLKETARLIQETLRSVDVVGRYGGEEFVALLPHTSPEEAAATAERIRRRVEGHVFWFGTSPLHVTVSIGVASYPSSEVDSPQALVREADRALYRAKEAGRNRVG
jgi:two-component system cell cycle response regulator